MRQILRAFNSSAVPIIPHGPRAAQQVQTNIPKGPKAGRFKDKDRVEPSSAAGLDYGDSAASSKSRTPSPIKRSSRRRRDSYSDDSRSPSRDRSRSPSRSRSPTPKREKPRSSRPSPSRSRSRSPTPKRERTRSSRSKKDREKSSGTSSKRRSGSTSKRKRDDVGLGPGGWESDGEQEERRSSR